MPLPSSWASHNPFSRINFPPGLPGFQKKKRKDVNFSIVSLGSGATKPEEETALGLLPSFSCYFQCAHLDTTISIRESKKEALNQFCRKFVGQDRTREQEEEFTVSLLTSQQVLTALIPTSNHLLLANSASGCSSCGNTTHPRWSSFPTFLMMENNWKHASQTMQCTHWKNKGS